MWTNAFCRCHVCRMKIDWKLSSNKGQSNWLKNKFGPLLSLVSHFSYNGQSSFQTGNFHDLEHWLRVLKHICAKRNKNWNNSRARQTRHIFLVVWQMRTSSTHIRVKRSVFTLSLVGVSVLLTREWKFIKSAATCVAVERTQNWNEYTNQSIVSQRNGTAAHYDFKSNLLQRKIRVGFLWLQSKLQDQTKLRAEWIWVRRGENGEHVINQSRSVIRKW